MTKPRSPLEVFNSIPQEEIDAFTKKFAQDMEDKKQKRIDFFESEKFVEIYNLIYDYVKEHGSMGDSDFQYNVTIDFITGDEYDEFINSISEVVEDEEDDDVMFATWYNHYKALSVRYMSGQGTVSDITLSESGERDVKLKEILNG